MLNPEKNFPIQYRCNPTILAHAEDDGVVKRAKK